MSFPVLICDDSSLARKMVKRSLPDELSQAIFTAENGQQALDILEQHPISLLFLDLTMPFMDGVEVLKMIKQKSIEVFVIVISGDIQPQMQDRVLSLGALDFIEKPVDSARLHGTLQRFGLY
ncbi:response regulator [Alteromonas sp. ASW11-36]|uniref:Response regulator n=1 Tax=Alteromonas arenosi TaxID=3055817 RepID=A0ABT7STI2_9ALTE|nr:response regulator [Alteromonas sp. ASW11-36]MDM7859485.1 response regulator [Alteromonas sp. ASW11-36]